ncbi:MAG: hypothetical protein BWZ10_01674 [candidate division BRC1 bacterium ADurb.BinA364]|nr:MAG: hypothetical protein BWZ10_01674 [candidate division BRC1 bacterium ADurb.BinA364]
MWIAYGDETASGGENVTLWRRPAGQPDFAGPYRVSPLPARQFAPDVEIDSQGRAHVVWVDKRAGTHVYYGIFDAAAGETVLEVRISETSGSYFRPSLALDSQGRAHVLYEESVSAIPPERSDLWFATTAPKTAARGWMRYR